MRSIDLTGQQFRHTDALYTLGLLANTVSSDHWCLAGGLMVTLNVIEAGDLNQFRAQQTKDADIVVGVAASGHLQAVVETLRNLGMVPAPPFVGDDHARCTFTYPNGTAIDVLAPDTATEEDIDLGNGMRTLAIPGGHHAITSAPLTEIIYIGLDSIERDAELRIPNWTDALIIKGLAALDQRTSNQPRHLDDIIDLLTTPSPMLTTPAAPTATTLPARIASLINASSRYNTDQTDLALDRLAELSSLLDDAKAAG